MRANMITSELDWRKIGEVHHHEDGKRYSLDLLVDIICAEPRPVEQLSLEGWRTERRRGLSRTKHFALVGPEETVHLFNPAEAGKGPRFPVVVCKRGWRLIVIDGIHRLVAAVKAHEKDYPCVYVTTNELKKCVMPDLPIGEPDLQMQATRR